MADIAMCLKKDCPSFDNCYNAQAVVVNPEWQTYGEYNNKGKAKCNDFIEYNPPKLDFLK